jgi:hypothetical protein
MTAKKLNLKIMDTIVPQHLFGDGNGRHYWCIWGQGFLSHFKCFWYLLLYVFYDIVTSYYKWGFYVL